MTPALDVEHLWVTYGGTKNPVTAVADISFAIKSGEVLGLMGHSGCGKTSLARALVGLVPHSGTVTLSGKNTANLTRRGQSRLVQPIFQNPFLSLNPALTVRRILAEPLRIHGGSDIGEKVAATLDALALSRDYALRLVSELSGGERQRVAIGCALMLPVPLLVADEICSALDAAAQELVLSLLRGRIRNEGTGCLFISHDTVTAENFCDRILHMENGRFVESCGG